MKKIKLIKGYVISAFNGPTENITTGLIDDLLEPIDHNKLVILDGAFDIERILEGIISHHFFSNHEVNKTQKNKFENLVLKSDWCSFSAKRKLVMQIINDLKLLEGKEKNEYENLLKKTMSYRNAFAHGEISTDGREVRLSYFEGNPQVKSLSEEFFTIIESDLEKCIELSFKVSNLSGANKLYRP